VPPVWRCAGLAVSMPPRRLHSLFVRREAVLELGPLSMCVTPQGSPAACASSEVRSSQRQQCGGSHPFTWKYGLIRTSELAALLQRRLHRASAFHLWGLRAMSQRRERNSRHAEDGAAPVRRHGTQTSVRISFHGPPTSKD